MINLTNFSSIFIANWKLNGNNDFIEEYFQKLLPSSENCVVICPPSIYLSKRSVKHSNVYLGSQDVSIYVEGAYTGDVSAKMLNDNNISFCLTGHSERRKYYDENNKIINKKTLNLINNNVIPVVCVGETLEEKEKKITKDILIKQITNGLPDISNFQNTLIAYEPIWAIGTGLTPTLDEIEEIHSFIKSIDNKFEKFKVLYGGSVNISNSTNINNLPNVDGSLIGGSSLNVFEFNKIIS